MFTGKKQQNRVLCQPIWDLGVTYAVQLWLIGKRVVDFLLVLNELFHQLSRLRRYEWILFEIMVFKMGMGHFEHKFQGKGVALFV